MKYIFKTVVFLVLWIVLTYICIIIVGDNPLGAEMPLVIMVYSFYLAPFMSILYLVLNLLIDRKVSKTKTSKFIILSLFSLLLGWALFVVYYIWNL